MSNADQPSSSDPTPQQAQPRRRRRRWLFAGGLGLAAFAGLLGARAVWANGPHHGRFGRAQTAQELREHLADKADFALSRVDATDDQRRRVDAILDQAAPQLFAVHQKAAGLKQELIDAMMSGDRAKAESARRQGLAWADEASRLLLSTLEQTLAVLDQKQRAKVQEHVERFRDRRHRGRHH